MNGKSFRVILLMLALPICSLARDPEESEVAFAHAVKAIAHAKLSYEKNGDPHIQSTGASPGWEILFLDCKSKICGSALFFATLDAPRLTAEDIDRLNRGSRYLRIYSNGPG